MSSDQTGADLRNQQPILSKRKLRELVEQVDPGEKLDPDVEAMLLELADDFIYNVTKSACRLAKHRQSDTLEVRDLQLHLETAYNIRIPGFGTDEARPVSTKRSVGGSGQSAHQQRLNQVKKAMALDSAERERVDRTRAVTSSSKPSAK